MNRYALLHGLWLGAAAGSHARFLRALRDPAAEQLRLLRDTLRHNAATDFGREHGFGTIANVDQYRRRVPLSTFEDYRDRVERIRRGERGVLTAEPVRRLVPSSGSAGARKLVPHTRTLAAQLNRAVGPWIADLHRTRPDLRKGPAYWSISPDIDMADEADPSGSRVPIGFAGDGDYLGGLVARLVEPTLAVPSGVKAIASVDAFRRATLLHLLRSKELRLISVWHPTFLSLLLDELEQSWDLSLDDLERGAAGIAPDRRRAAELRACGPSCLAAIWPRLGLISAWGDAHAGNALSGLAARFPGVAIQPKGLLATEGVVTIPFAGARPLAVRSHFFEFLDDNGRSHLVHELAPDAEYGVVLTTGGGLYRYRTGDRVRVEGRLRGTPCLGFVGRDDQVSDRRGEKLSDSHVALALQSVLQPLRPDVAFAMLAPDAPDGPDESSTAIGYTLYLETGRPLPPELGLHLERALGENPHYRYCVAVGQLAPARIFRVTAGASAAYLSRCHGEGRRLGDVKPVALSRRSGWSAIFDGRYAANHRPSNPAGASAEAHGAPRLASGTGGNRARSR